jgi:hypothetical protein
VNHERQKVKRRISQFHSIPEKKKKKNILSHPGINKLGGHSKKHHLPIAAAKSVPSGMEFAAALDIADTPSSGSSSVRRRRKGRRSERAVSG